MSQVRTLTIVIRSLAYISALIVGGVALGAVDNLSQAYDFSYRPICPANGSGIDFSLISPIRSERDLTAKDIGSVIPQNLKNGETSSSVASKIFDQSMSTLFNNEDFKHSGIGRTAHTVEQKMSSDVSWGGANDNSVKQNVSMKVQAAQAKAQIDYSGYANAQLNYLMARQELNLEVFHDLTNATKLVYGHAASPVETKDTVSVRFSF